MKDDHQVRVQVFLEKLTFPDICPVCCNRADTETHIKLNVGSYLDASQFSGLLIKTGQSARARFHTHGADFSMRKSFSVPTCCEHKPTEIRSMIKIIWFAFSVISIVPILLLFYQTSYAFLQGTAFSSPLVGLVSWVFCLIGLSSFIYWPRPFQRYFKITGLAPNGADLLLEIKNPTYRAELLKINPMYAETVDM
ncbi:MAG: hypothetical protein RTU92_14080 [Candidatus Thorarchaeota archaeon]